MPAMARHQDRRKLLSWRWRYNWWVSAALSGCRCNAGLLGDGVWFRSGRRISALLLLALDHSAQPAIAGKLVAFSRGSVLSSPGLPRGFLVCCVYQWQLLDGLGVSCAVRRWVEIITLRFAPARFPQLWVKEAYATLVPALCLRWMRPT